MKEISDAFMTLFLMVLTSSLWRQKACMGAFLCFVKMDAFYVGFSG